MCKVNALFNLIRQNDIGNIFTLYCQILTFTIFKRLAIRCKDYDNERFLMTRNENCVIHFKLVFFIMEGRNVALPAVSSVFQIAVNGRAAILQVLRLKHPARIFTEQ